MPDMPIARPVPLVDDAAATAAAEHLRARLDHDHSGALDPDLHAHGVALAAHRMERGAPGFHAVALSIAAELRAEPGRLRRFLRPWYEGARDLLEDHDRVPPGVDGPDAVRAALRALAGTPDAPAPRPMPDPLPGLLDPPAAAPDPDADPAGWDTALARAEHAAARPAPSPAPAPQEYAPPEAVVAAQTGLGASRGVRKGVGYRISDLMWGAFFVPGVLVGLVVFLYFLALPPMTWLTGIATWDVRDEAGFALIGVLVWLTSLSLLFPPIWYAWRRGRRSWIWPVLAAPVVTAVLVFMSTLIVLRSPMHPDFAADAMKWAWMWGPVTFSAAASVAFGPRLRGFSRRVFRRFGRWWDRQSGGEPRR